MDHSLWGIFDAVAAAVGDREAIVWRGRRLRYGELRERCLRLAGVLADHGLGRHRPRAALAPWEAGQDLVATYLLNGPEYLEVSLGGSAAATAPFNVNHRYVATELRYLLDDGPARAVVYHERFAPVLADVLPTLRERPAVLLQVADGSGHGLVAGAVDYEEALAAATPLAAPDVDPDDLYVLYTGGTTGMPKGTLWRQADIWRAVLGATFGEVAVDDVVAAARTETGRLLPNAPFMHGAAQWLGLRALLTGGTVVVNDTNDRFDPLEAWRLVEAERIDTMLLVGEAMARPVIDAFDARPVDAGSLQVFVVGGAVTSPETKRRLLERVPTAIVADSAGASETGGVLASTSTRSEIAAAGVFTPNPWVAVLDAELTRRLEPGEDELGWFAKHGAIPLGYLGDEDKTRRTFPEIDGTRWVVVGDRARHRADGTVELLGRDSVTINTGGEKVFAEEVEAALLTHPAVTDVIVVGRPDERWGQVVVAVAALADPDVADDDLLDAAARRIARFKLPRSIVRVPTVVRSPAGKADYRWAREIAAEVART